MSCDVPGDPVDVVIAIVLQLWLFCVILETKLLRRDCDRLGLVMM